MSIIDRGLLIFNNLIDKQPKYLDQEFIAMFIFFPMWQGMERESDGYSARKKNLS